MKKVRFVFLLSLSTIYYLLSTIPLAASLQQNPAAAGVEIILNSKDPGTLRLLRLTGVLNAGDWQALKPEEQKILRLAFDEQGRLTPIGQRLLQELLSARLDNPNRRPAPKAPPSGGSGLSAKTSSLFLFASVPKTAETLSAGVSQIFARTNAQPTEPPLVLPGYDWSKYPPPSLNEQPGADRPRVRLIVAPKKQIQQSRYNVHLQPNAQELTEKILLESGIDAQLLASHQARPIAALSAFNLLIIEAPYHSVRSLAQTLDIEGIYGRPANSYELTIPGNAGGAAQTTSWASWFGAGLRQGAAALGRLGAPLKTPGSPTGFQPALRESVNQLRPNKFYAQGYTGGQATVLIVDTGVDKDHPVFKGKNVIQIDLTNQKNNKDAIGHGTHVASIAAGAPEGARVSYGGVAPGTKNILAAKIFDGPNTSEDLILAGLDWGVNQTAGRKIVINLSLGGRGDPNDVLSRAANTLAHRGHAVVAAAGNSGPRANTVASPGLARDVLTIAATDKNGSITGYSSRGNPGGYKTPALQRAVYAKPDLSLPGGGASGGFGGCRFANGIVAAKSHDMPKGPCDVLIENQPLYTRMSGTSMATPHATGSTLLIFDYLEQHGGLKDSSFLESKAAQMEAAGDIKKGTKSSPKNAQGSGLQNLDRLYDLISSRMEMGLPIGNLSAEIALWTSANERRSWEISKNSAYRITRYGIVNPQNGNIINSDQELHQLISKIEAKPKGGLGGFKQWLDWKLYKWFGWNRQDGTGDPLEATG
ncbi:MAG: S8 family serine peptidase [Elusimicrobia bacterium]|nr:S8 family serine peptidase [Elusimicrobiota bacterium]